MEWKLLKYNQNWNIGFITMRPDELIKAKSLGKIEWLHHPFKDRWFADPFIVSEDESKIVVFAEECTIHNPKGIIVELVVETKTKKLLDRHELLSLSTHLSYPIFYKSGDKIYVYPENGRSGSLYIYEYDASSHKLINPQLLMNEPLADATILHHKNINFMIATKYPHTQENTVISYSDDLKRNYFELKQLNNSKKGARPAGNFFETDKGLFRPGQDCTKRYGAGLCILKVISTDTDYNEELIFTLTPNSYRYNLGLHTLNFGEKTGVIDGYGYYYPLMGRVLNIVRMVRKFVIK